MIRRTSIEAAGVLALKLNEAGIRLSPIQGTPTEAILNGGFNPVLLDKDYFSENKDYWGLVWEACNLIKTPDRVGYCELDQRFGDSVKLLAKAAQNHLSFARNVVNPKTIQLATDVEEYLHDKEVSIGSAISVNQTEWANIWDSPVLHELAGEWKFVPFDPNVPIPKVHPLVTNEQLRTAISKTDTKFDKEINEFLDSYGADNAMSIYKQWLVDPAVSNVKNEWTDGAPITWLVGSSPYDRDTSLFIFLLARGLLNEPLDNTTMGLAEYSEFISAVMRQAGRAVCVQLQNRAFAKENKMMIISYPYNGSVGDLSNPESAQIVVNSDLYNTWLENGGKPEILFGAAVSDKENNMERLIENGPAYINKWSQYNARLLSGQRANIYNNTRLAIHVCMSNLITGLSADELGDRTARQLIDCLNTEIRVFSETDVSDIYGFCRKLICKVLYPFSNALYILTAMGEVLKQDPGLTERDAAGVVILKVLCKYVADCLKTEM